MQTLKGTVQKIRILKYATSPLVRFSLDDTNCIIALHSLSFLADVEDGMQVVVCGNYNARKQFVVRKYSVIGKTKIILEFEKNKYPKNKLPVNSKYRHN